MVIRSSPFSRFLLFLSYFHFFLVPSPLPRCLPDERFPQGKVATSPAPSDPPGSFSDRTVSRPFLLPSFLEGAGSEQPAAFLMDGVRQQEWWLTSGSFRPSPFLSPPSPPAFRSTAFRKILDEVIAFHDFAAAG